MLEDLRIAAADYMYMKKIPYQTESNGHDIFYKTGIDAAGAEFVELTTRYAPDMNKQIVNGLGYKLWATIMERNPIPGNDMNPNGSLDLTLLDETAKVQSASTEGNKIITRINLKELEKVMTGSR